MFHIYMAGKLAEHMVHNRLTRASSDMFDLLFRPRLVCEGAYLPGELGQVEAAKIKEMVAAGHVVFNTKKRAEISRAPSRSSKTTSP